MSKIKNYSASQLHNISTWLQVSGKEDDSILLSILDKYSQFRLQLELSN